MGATISRLARRFLPKTGIRILMVGLDASGKTTILYKLKLGEIVLTVPTIGFNVETVVYKNISFTVWDVGGQQKIRPLWRYYFQNSHGLIFVVDSNDRGRISEARNELHRILSDIELKDAILLVFANKQDVPNAMSVSEVTDKLGLPTLKQHRWQVHSKLFCHFRTWTIRRKTEGTFKVAASSSLPNRIDHNYCTLGGRSTRIL
uniref:ADP-ribosylation factor family protein n=1 Tax=Populus alba TaxID=43335 RepID=A0A4U5Q655_POPAL|nr:hypothetical protein D5086_0000132980 [Populus alba]